MRCLLLTCLCLLALLAIAPLARAQAGVFHCIGAHGEPVYSGQPCGNPAAPPGASGADAQPGGFGGVCASSPEALRQAIAGAFANRDVNRLAGLILWRGVGRDAARATLQSLAEWLRQPLTGIASAYAAGPPRADVETMPPTAAGANAALPAAAPQVPSGFAVSTGGPDGSTRDFGVTQAGACWWLTF